MASLNQLIECPICYDVLKPPVTTCKNGHGICENCRPKIRTCAICKEGFSSVKNTLLNQILETVQAVQCINNAKGCKKRSPTISDMREHEKLCNYTSEKCCACSKTEILSLGMNDHFKTHKHLVASFNQDFSFIVNCEGKNKNQYYSYTLAFVKSIEQHFIVRIKVNQKEKLISLLLQYLGKKEEANNYFYAVKVYPDLSSDQPWFCLHNRVCVPYFFPLKDIDSHEKVVKLDLKSIFSNESYVLSKLKISVNLNANE